MKVDGLIMFNPIKSSQNFCCSLSTNPKHPKPHQPTKHGSLNVPIEHHPTIRYMVYNGYYKVMSNIPKMGHLPTPAKAQVPKRCLDRVVQFLAGVCELGPPPLIRHVEGLAQASTIHGKQRS